MRLRFLTEEKGQAILDGLGIETRTSSIRAILQEGQLRRLSPTKPRS
jgi:hypothetical protein